ncbi:MAG: hypothetical protein ACOC1G_07935 [Phycisphaeraceae bacterium]
MPSELPYEHTQEMWCAREAMRFIDEGRGEGGGAGQPRRCPPGEDVGELYDLEADPDETRNLYHDADHAETVTESRRRLFDWLIQTTRLSPGGFVRERAREVVPCGLCKVRCEQPHPVPTRTRLLHRAKPYLSTA